MIEDDLSIRLNYHGGSVRQDRMVRDKLWSLKSAMRSSYHRATAILSDGCEFNCLLNPSKLNADVDYKEISIPFKDVCLNMPIMGKASENEMDIPLKCGDIFTWKETCTDWLVYVQRIDEIAYFRAGCYKCNIEVEFNGYTQKGHIIGPGQRLQDWRYARDTMWLNINYDAVLLLPKTPEVLEYLKRFDKVKTAEDQQWEVQARNMMLEGIIEIALKEDYINTAADAQRIDPDPEPPMPGEAYIDGPLYVDCFEKYTYTIVNMNPAGTWSITETKLATILKQEDDTIEIGITSKKSGKLHINYSYEGIDVTLEVTIRSI